MRRNILIIISFLTLLVSSGCTNLMRSGIPKSLRTLISRLRKLFILSWYALSHIGVGFTDSTVPFFKNVQQMRCVSHKKEYITMMSDIPTAASRLDTSSPQQRRNLAWGRHGSGNGFSL